MWNFPSIEIPGEFYSSKSEKLIEECVLCGKNILVDSEPYIIEKAFRNNEITKETELIFEYALCAECQQITSSELSKDSLNNIKMYYDLYVDFEKRQTGLKDIKSFQLKDWISNCIITGAPLVESKEFQIGGLFLQNQLLLGNLPFAVGEKAINELQELISKKTRDFLDGFKEKIIPPGVSDKVPDDFLILM